MTGTVWFNKITGRLLYAYGMLWAWPFRLTPARLVCAGCSGWGTLRGRWGAKCRSMQRLVRLYFCHLAKNWKVAGKATLLAVFHFAHGIIPCRWTEHEKWGINLCKPNEEI